MATSGGISNLKKPWAWLVVVAVFGLVLALSTALYEENPVVNLPLPWWAAVAAPVLVYALVLPLCVPRIRMGGWLAGVLILAIVQVGLALATAGLYATVRITSFEQALTTALWGFPPALVLAMIGSLAMTLPFLGALAPRAAVPRLQAASPPRGGATRGGATRGGATPEPRRASLEAAVIPGMDRHVWAHGPAVAARALEEPPPAVARRPAPTSDESAVHTVPLVGTIGAAPDTAEAESLTVESDVVAPPALPDFGQALSELLDAPAAEPAVGEPSVPPDNLVAPQELVAEEPSWRLTADPPAVALDSPIVIGAVVRIPFDRVLGQLPQGAFRVPLGQVGARLREAEILIVPQAVIVPQLGEGVVQVEWELVEEQFPAAVFAMAPAEVKEQIVNGRLLLPLDEIVCQLPPDVFATSLGREPVEVPGIESVPVPFKPLGWTEPLPEPTVAQAIHVTVSAPPAPRHAVPEPVPVPKSAPEPLAVEGPVQARTIETRSFAAPRRAHPERWSDSEKIAALLTPWGIAAFDEAQIGDFAIVSVSAAGLAGGAVAAAAGRLSPLIARRAPRPVDQATLRGVGGTLVLTPVGSGWSTGTTLAVGVRPGCALARVQMLARHAAAAHDPPSLAAAPREAAPAVRFDAAPPPAAVVKDLEAFGPLTAQTYREPATGALIHCFVSPGTSAADLAPFAWELAQAMAQGAQAGALGSFHSAVLLSGGERLEIRRLGYAAGSAPILVVGGADTGRPGLAHLQVERAAARLETA
jgi:hypothetical protein